MANVLSVPDVNLIISTNLGLISSVRERRTWSILYQFHRARGPVDISDQDGQ